MIKEKMKREKVKWLNSVVHKNLVIIISYWHKKPRGSDEQQSEKNLQKHEII